MCSAQLNESAPQPVVSVIVPAWNEQDYLAPSLESIHRACEHAGVSYEIIVADDASTDATVSIARSCGATVVSCNHRQIAATRNAGARVSRGRILIFVDADTLVGLETIKSAVHAIDRGAGYGGADVVWDGGVPPWARLTMRAIIWLYRRLGLASGAFLFCTRESFERVGGFDESLYAAEECYLARALRKTERYVWVTDHVTTSARKIRGYGPWRLLWRAVQLGVLMMMRGRRALTSREKLDLWYAERQVDPLAAQPEDPPSFPARTRSE